MTKPYGHRTYSEPNLRLVSLKQGYRQEGRMRGHRSFILGDALSRRSGLLRTEPLRVSAVPEPDAIARERTGA